jgi:putative endonuclease
MERARTHYAYLLRCGDGSYYAGYTVDPARRLAAHLGGRASRYTRGRGPQAFAALWRCPTRRAGLALERLLKRLSHARKHDLALGGALAAAAALRARRVPRRRWPPAATGMLE